MTPGKEINPHKPSSSSSVVPNCKNAPKAMFPHLITRANGQRVKQLNRMDKTVFNLVIKDMQSTLVKVRIVFVFIWFCFFREGVVVIDLEGQIS